MATKKIEDGIRSYLDSLGQSDKPVVDREAVKALKAQIRSEADSINKLKLLAHLEEEEAGRVPDTEDEKAVFVAEAKAWADGEGVTVTAFQALGVPDEVLKEAGFDVPAGGTPKASPASGRRSSGTRAPAIPLDVVAAEAKKLGSGWKVADLAAKLDREPMTVRNYVLKLIERGAIADLGDDPAHDGRGRAAKIYGVE
jgi:hypothetical protein